MKRACFPVIPGRALARTRNPERQAVRLHLDSVFAAGAGSRNDGRKGRAP
jgi:hypothetical protein